MSLAAIGALLMPVWGVLSRMLIGLLSEAFIKKAMIIGLEHLVKKTETKEDDELLAAAKKAWNAE